MTTVVVDSKRMIMAADSMVNDGVLAFKSRKIFAAPNGDLVGIAGTVCDAILFKEWYVAGADRSALPPLPADTDMVALTLSKRGVEVWDKRFIPIVDDSEFYGIGSGAHAALAALHCGRTLEEAMVVACKIDHGNSGLPIHIVEWKPLPAPKRGRSKGARKSAV